MANENALSDRDVHRPSVPVVRSIDASDLTDSLTKGIEDFKAMPTHLVHFAWIYPAVIVLGTRAYAGYDVLPFVFPLVAGYTLVGPLIAIGMYELSRCREREGQVVSRMRAFDALRSPSIRSIAALGLLLMAIYFVWLIAAQVIYVSFFGTADPTSIPSFIDQIVNTPEGWGLMFVGCGVGFVFATAVFVLSVVSFPMLLDRDVSVATAAGTSIRAVLRNPVTMFIWGLIVAVTLILGAIPLFVGLAVVMPVLGHATWHLYRKVVDV